MPNPTEPILYVPEIGERLTLTKAEEILFYTCLLLQKIKRGQPLTERDTEILSRVSDGCQRIMAGVSYLSIPFGDEYHLVQFVDDFAPERRLWVFNGDGNRVDE